MMHSKCRPAIKCLSRPKTGFESGKARELLFLLYQVSPVQIQIRLRNYFGLRKVFLQRINKSRSLTYNDQAGRWHEIFLSERCYILCRYCIDRRNKLVQSFKRQIENCQTCNLTRESQVSFEASRVVASKQCLPRL